MRRLALALPLALIAAAVLNAQTPPAPAPRAPSSVPEAPTRTTVSPGDTLKVIVYGHDDLTLEIKVPSSGEIMFPLCGRVSVTGRTPEQVAQDLSQRLEKDYLVDPNVSVFLLTVAPKWVYVMGSVNKPHNYEIPAGQTLTLLQAVSMAEGFTQNALKSDVRIFRRKNRAGPERETLHVDTTLVTEGGQANADPLLQPDDMVVVPEQLRIYVLGQVNMPGGFTVAAEHPITASQAASLAGGFTKIAKPSKAHVLRGAGAAGSVRKIEVDLDKVLEDGQLEKDVVLQPGDILFIPESYF